MYNSGCPKEMKNPRTEREFYIMKKKIMAILQEYFDFAERYHIYDYKLR